MFADNSKNNNVLYCRKKKKVYICITFSEAFFEKAGFKMILIKVA
jgi:N-acetylglutamate synthase-like GNAT family acetyltransferase